MCKRHIINAIGFSRNKYDQSGNFNGYWDLPDGPVVKTALSQAEETKIPYAI